MTVVEFKIKYPDFAVSDDDIQNQLDLFALLYQTDFGDLGDYLAGLYVAHQLTVFNVNTGSAPSGVITDRSVSEMSWKYKNSSSSDKAGDFASTKYGLEFYRVSSMFGLGPMII